MDCEMTGLHQKTTLISIGLISECGKTFYAELTDYNKGQVDDWLEKNVIDKLCLEKPQGTEEARINYRTFKKDGCMTYCGGMANLKHTLTDWFAQFEQVEMWSDCLSYDWVLFNSIFGDAFSIPKNVYYIPFDLSSLFKIYGYDPNLSRKDFSGLNEATHNALGDAKMIKACYDKLMSI